MAELSVPQIDFSGVGQLPQIYRQAQNDRALDELGQRLASGAPIDYRQAAGMAARAGRYDLSMAFLKSGDEQDASRDFQKMLAGYAGGNQPSPAPALTALGNGQAVRPQDASPLRAAPSAENIPAPARAPVVSTPKVWGDAEAVSAGLYDAPGQTPQQPASPSARVANGFSQANAGPAPVPVTPNPAAANVMPLMIAAANPRLSQGQRQLANTLLTNALNNNKATDEERNYSRYWVQTTQSGGQPVSFMDYQLQLKRAGATAITNDMRGENAEAKALGEGAGKRANDTMAAAAAAPKKLQNLSRMQQMLTLVQQGKMQPARMTISAWAKSFGLDDNTAMQLGLDPKGVGTAQAIEALSNEMTLGHIGPGGLPANNFSNTDRTFITAIVPQLGNDPEANALKVEASRRLAQLDLDKGKAWQQYRRSNRGRSYDDFEIEWSDKVSKQDLFADLAQKAQAIIGQGQQSGARTGTGVQWRIVQ